MFPVESPRIEELDARGLFACQNPELRSKILPLFRFDPQRAEERPIGYGTTFRIDPWARCATAFHVIEDLFLPPASGSAAMALRNDARLVAPQIDGIGYGLNRFSLDAWRPIHGAYSIFGIETPPFQPPRIRNATELMALQIRPNGPAGSPAPYLTVDLTRWHPRIGERILALGFAGLDVDSRDEGEQRPMSQYLYGSFASILEIERPDGSRGRPWPQIRVEAEWPGGMSGGPVFNEVGHVVGLVSAGIEGHGIASATYFSAWDIPERIFTSLDAANPGMFRCYAVFDREGALARFGPDRAALENYAREHGHLEISSVSIRPETRDYIRI